MAEKAIPCVEVTCSRVPMYFLHCIHVALRRNQHVLVVGSGAEVVGIVKLLIQIVRSSGFVSVFACSMRGIDSSEPKHSNGDVLPQIEATLQRIRPIPPFTRYESKLFKRLSTLVEENRVSSVYINAAVTLGANKKGKGAIYNRFSGLGFFAVLSDSLLYRIIKRLSVPELCLLSVISREFKLFSEDEKRVWKKEAKWLGRCNFWFKGTWKRTVLDLFRHSDPNFPSIENGKLDWRNAEIYRGRLAQKRLRVHVFKDEDGERTCVYHADSDELPEQVVNWYYCGILPINEWSPDFCYPISLDPKHLEESGMKNTLIRRLGQWVRTSLNCSRDLDLNLPPHVQSIDRRDARELTIEEFIEKYDKPGIPVLLTNACITQTGPWPALTEWTEDLFLQNYRKKKLRVGEGLRMTMERYFHYAKTQQEERPLYLFDDDFDEKIPKLLDDYNPPTYFEEDFFNLITRKRPPFRWIVIGSERTGSAFHTDPWQTSAWNALLKGTKRWAFYPPGVIPPGVTGDEDGTGPRAMKWFLEHYPFIIPSLRPLECVQSAGEIIFVPSGWWHLVLNVDATFCVTQNFVNPQNLPFVALDIASQPRKWTPSFKKQLRCIRPDLFEDGELDAVLEGTC